MAAEPSYNIDGAVDVSWYILMKDTLEKQNEKLKTMQADINMLKDAKKQNLDNRKSMCAEIQRGTKKIKMLEQAMKMKAKAAKPTKAKKAKK